MTESQESSVGTNSEFYLYYTQMGLLQNYSYNRLVLLFTIAIVKSNTSLATVGLRRKLQRKRKRRCRMRKSVGDRNSSEILLLLYNTLYCLKGLLELRTHCTLHAHVHTQTPNSTNSSTFVGRYSQTDDRYQFHQQMCIQLTLSVR